MNKSKIFLVLISFAMLSFTMHKYYMSLCEIEYIEDQKVVQITLSIFLDDLEVSLNKNRKTNLTIGSQEDPFEMDSIYLSYLKENLSLIINNKNTAFNYIGKEYDTDIVLFYLEVTDISKLNSLEMSNTILLNDFEDQKNIVKIKIKNFHKTWYLNKNNRKDLIIF